MFSHFFACDNISNQLSRTEIFKSKSIETIGASEYYTVLESFNDSLKIWKLNNLFGQIDTSQFKSYLDSLLCFNINKNRLVACVLKSYNIPNATSFSDGIELFFGEKLDNKWYFFSGAAHLVVPRELYPNHNVHTPLSYHQIHQMAIKEFYSGYLKSNGEINEEWFTHHFENNGWGNFNKQEYFDWCFKGKRYLTDKEFKIASHMCKVKANWMQRDTTQPIKRLP